MGSPDSIKEFEAGSRGWWSKRYIIDYVTCFALFQVMGICYYIVSPHVMEIPGEQTNPTVTYSYKSSTVPSVSLFLISGLIPILVFILLNVPRFLRARKLAPQHAESAKDLRSRSFHDIHNAILGLAQSLSIMFCVIMLFKFFAGRNRPNYYSLIEHGGRIEEARQSFPSGHSAFAFAGLSYLSLWMAGKLRAFSPASPWGGRVWVPLLCLAPAFGAGFVAISRTRDYWHNFSDIISGSVIGIFCAVVSYFSLYPSLLSERAGIPKFRVANPSSKGFLPL